MWTWLRNWTLGKKLLAAPLVAVCCLVALGVVSQRQTAARRGILGGEEGSSRVARVAEIQVAVSSAQDSASAEGRSTALGEATRALKALAAVTSLPAEGKAKYQACVDRLQAFRPTTAGTGDGFLPVGQCFADLTRFEAQWEARLLGDLDRSSTTTIWAAGIGAALSLGFAFLLTNRSRVGVQSAEGALERLAAGDLRERVTVSSSDEIGTVLGHVNALAGKLQAALVQVSASSSHVAAAANALQGSARDLASGVDEAAAQVNAIATAGEQMSTTTAEIAQNCAKAAKSAEQANGAAVTGEAVIGRTLAAMERISEMVTATAQVIRGLQDRSDRIGQVVELINDIADQTSLLALNAAIEAARAGENGRGFAVVADEVRKLADRTTKATQEIGKTIVEIQGETREAVRAMERGVDEVEVGAAEAQKSGDSLRQILEQVRTVTAEVAQIAVASEEQTSTSEHIARNIQQVSGVMQQTALKIQTDVAGAEELAKLAAQLRKLVSDFRVFTRADAERMVEEAVAYVRAHGKEAALREFQDPRGKFSKGELFVYAQDLTGTVLAHAGNPGLVGQNHHDLPDAKGKFFVRELVATAKQAGSGWVDYHFMNPATQRVQPKTTFCRKVDDYMVACGIYS